MVTIDQIKAAANALDQRIAKTPLIQSPTLSRITGKNVYLKLENMQKTGSFKIRGATFKILKNIDKISPKGVVAASAGNHAQGVAMAAKYANLPSTIVMPEWASISKQEATAGYGGKVVIAGSNISESLSIAKDMAKKGKVFIHPFDDDDIITGQGTIGLEILINLRQTDVIIVPIGGGGIISGIAVAAKSINPNIKIIGVQSQSCPSAYQAMDSGKRMTVDPRFSIADGINVKQIGKITFEYIRKFVDQIVLVKEEEIAAAMVLLLERKKILSEGAGATPLAALLSGKIDIPDKANVVLVISGGNVDSPLLGRIIHKGLINNGRIIRFMVCLDDQPGSLSRLLDKVAELKANVVHIYHDRNIRELPVQVTRVELELETRNNDHIQKIVDQLQKQGYEITRSD